MNRKQLILILAVAVWITVVAIYQFGTDELRDGLFVGLFFGVSWKLGLAIAYSIPALLLGPALYLWFRKSA
jgi:hypothetical protein